MNQKKMWSMVALVAIPAAVIVLLPLRLLVDGLVSALRPDPSASVSFQECTGDICALPADRQDERSPEQLAQTDPIQISLAYFEDYYRQMYAFEDGDDYFVAFEPFGVEENGDGTTEVYLWLLATAYGVKDGQALPRSGGSEPLRFTLHDSKVIQMYQAEDGGHWLASVREIFPKEIALKVEAFDSRTLSKQMDELVKEYYAAKNPPVTVATQGVQR